ncbi:MAG: hypothetical protein KKD38_04115 [Candidatus Delongbacteria bacterium]|nr:hypothetical protein [Candidatus Delongbacteria bacterium]MCG2761475.1 hypothetical protein [Candidatus Delongbacteria bacterium]
MKLKHFLLLTFVAVAFVSFTGCSKKSKPLNGQLDDLEKIIVKYEPKFEKIEYASKEYGDIIEKYNKEILDWAKIFEKDRYTKDSRGNAVPSEEFRKIENRFYELNKRMSKMVLAKIPKEEKRPESEGQAN